jgi:hypothetical protein
MKTEIIENVLYIEFYEGNFVSFRIQDNCIFIRSTNMNVKDIVTVELTGDYVERIIQGRNYLASLA